MIDNRFNRLLKDSGSLGREIVVELARRRLPQLGAWCLRTIAALPDNRQMSAGFRDLRYSSVGIRQWFYPRSNAAERITVYLKLAAVLHDLRYFDAAVHYADAMLDPVYGIYDGPEEYGKGQVYYWRDCGMYMTNYTMRVPPAMFQLYDATGQEKYRRAALLSGEALLRFQRENGVLCEGFMPRHPVDCSAPCDPDETADWLTDYKINSRIGWAVYAFAELYRRTRDDRYARALEKLSYALYRYQYEDGSFPADLALRHYKPITPQVKNHYLGYILNGAAAALQLAPEVPYLRQVTLKLGEYVFSHYRRSWGWPYGNVDTDCPEEEVLWHSASADVSSGLVLLSRISGDPAFAECAAKMLTMTLLNTIDMPENPDVDGAIPIWCRRGRGRCPPSLDGYYHFYTVLGLMQLLEESQPAADKEIFCPIPACAAELTVPPKVF